MIKPFSCIFLMAALATSLAHAAPSNPDIDTALAAVTGAQSVIAVQTAAQALRDKYDLTKSGGTSSVAKSVFEVGGDAVIELVDMRLLLAQIAVRTGARDHLALERAQVAGVHEVILLRGGSVTLVQFQRLMAASAAAEFVTFGPQGVTLTRALVIWADAGLTLAQGETLILSRLDGSFLTNLGWLDIQGGSISGSTPPNQGEPSFRPFVLTAGSGSLTVSQAHFANLGFGDTPRFGGVAVDNSGLEPAQTPPVIRDSHFVDVASLAFISTKFGAVTDNMMNASSILIANALDTAVTGNFSNAPSRAAMRITKASVNTRIADNIILGAPLGIWADQSSQRLVLSGNVLAGQASSAIRLDKVGCAEVTGNLALRGLGSGMALSATGRVAIAGNVIVDNLGAGIWLHGQGKTASTHVTGNTFANNHEGLRGATAGDLTLSGNDLNGQLPRLFAGDLSPRTILWLEDRRSKGLGPRVADPTPICPDEGNI